MNASDVYIINIAMVLLLSMGSVSMISSSRTCQCWIAILLMATDIVLTYPLPNEGVKKTQVREIPKSVGTSKANQFAQSKEEQPPGSSLPPYLNMVYKGSVSITSSSRTFQCCTDTVLNYPLPNKGVKNTQVQEIPISDGTSKANQSAQGKEEQPPGSSLQPYLNKVYILDSNDLTKTLEIMKALDASWMFQRALSTFGNSKSSFRITKNKDQYTVYTSVPDAPGWVKKVIQVDSSYSFQLEKEFEQKSLDGRDVISVASIQGNKMILTQTDKKNQSIVTTTTREFSPDKVILTLKFKDIESKSTFKEEIPKSKPRK